MAVTDAGAQATRQHRRRQVEVANETRARFVRLWPLWTVTDRGSFDRLVEAALPLAESRHRVSATLAQQYLSAFRLVEGAADIDIAGLPTFERDRVAAGMYATGQSQTQRALQAGLTVEAVRQQTLVTVTGSLVRNVLAGGRDTVAQTVEDDLRIVGWMRITGPNPCAFCAMLASRGPVFKTGQSALRVGRATAPEAARHSQQAGFGRRRGTRPRDEPYHDHCVCTAEPMYEGSTMTPEAQAFRDLWNESTQGKSGNAAINAFRRAHEGGITTAA